MDFRWACFVIDGESRVMLFEDRDSALAWARQDVADLALDGVRESIVLAEIRCVVTLDVTPIVEDIVPAPTDDESHEET